MTAPRRRLIVKELREHSTYHNVVRSCGSGPLQPPLIPVLRDEQAALARRIEELARVHPRYGYRRIWALLDREGWSVNKKAVRRIWRQSGLKLAKPQAVPKPRRPHGQDRNACHLRPSRGRTTYGHGTLSSIEPATAVASSGRVAEMNILVNAWRWSDEA